MIRNPNDIQDGAKKIRMLIAGYPGIGKSTLALSAPRPLHIDCDFGIDRIEPRYRMPYIQPRSYDEILNDLKPENLKDFETLVFDTAGKLISLMGLWAIKQNPKYGQRDGSLSLKGYGFVGREFVRLMDYCFYELKKNIWYMPLFSTDVWYMRRQIAQMNLLFEPKGEPAKIEKTDIKPANLQKSIKNEPKAPENEPLNETKTGQLTFF